jgi:AcrR family transcriptional regulator
MEVPRVDRREQKKLETRQRLLDAAARVFSAMGYETASVLDITEAADVSKRTFYLHFTDKEDVIEALAMRGFQELRGKVEAHEQKHDDVETFREGFHWVVRTIFEYTQQHPELMHIVFGRDGSFRLQAMTREFMVQAWEENLERKCVWRADAPVPPKVVANAIAGVIFQLLCWWANKPNEYTPDQMAAICVSCLHDGIEVNLEPELSYHGLVGEKDEMP